MQVANRVIKNTGILYARMAITVFISLYSTRLILAGLGATDYGIFNVVAGAIAMLTFLNSAMAGATQRFISYAEGQGDSAKVKTIFNVSVILHLLIALLVVGVLEAGGYFLFEEVLRIPPERIAIAKTIYQFMVVSTVFTIISVPYDAVINAHENMMLVAVLGIVEALIKLGIAFYLTYSAFDKLYVYGVLTAACAVILLIIRRIYCHNKYKECELGLIKYFDRDIFKEMTSFAGWSFLGSSSTVVASYGQGIVMNMFFGPIVNAAQGITNQVSGQLGAFATMMLKALNPIIAKSEGGNDRALMLKASMIGCKFSFLLLAFFFIPVLIEMPYIFNVWLGKVPEFAVIFCRLYLIRNLIDQFYVTFGASISAVGHIRKYQIATTFTAIFPILICYILFNLGFAAYWLYIIFIIFSVVNFLVSLYFTKIYCGLSVKSFAKYAMIPSIIIFSVVSGIAIIPTLFLSQGFYRLALVIFLSVVVFLLSTWFVGFNREEKNLLTSLVKKAYYRFSNRKSILNSQI